MGDASDLPPAGSRVHRTTGRVLPVDPSGRVLLLHGWDPERPESPYWFTIGGAVEAGESLAEAAARELSEEVGITVEVAKLGAPLLQSTVEFEWGGWHIVQSQTFFAVAVDEVAVSLDGLDAWEQDTIDGHAWWTPDALQADGGAAHPEIVTAMRSAIRRISAG